MERYIQTAYSTNVYLQLGPLSRQLTRHTRETVSGAQGVKVECVFLKKPKKKKAEAVPKPSSKVKGGKRKRAASFSEDEEEKDEIVIVSDEESEDNEQQGDPRGTGMNDYERSEDDNDSDDIMDDWSHTMRNTNNPPPVKRPRIMSGTIIRENNKDVLVLSD